MWCICGARLSTKCGARLSTKTTRPRGVPYPANVALVHRTAKSSRSRGVAKPTCWLTQQRATRLPSRPTLAMQIWLMMPACQASSSPNASLVWSKMTLTTPAASTVTFQKMATEAADCERGGGSPSSEREHISLCVRRYTHCGTVRFGLQHVRGRQQSILLQQPSRPMRCRRWERVFGSIGF